MKFQPSNNITSRAKRLFILDSVIMGSLYEGSLTRIEQLKLDRGVGALAPLEALVLCTWVPHSIHQACPEEDIPFFAFFPDDR